MLVEVIKMSVDEICLYQLTRPYVISEHINTGGVGNCNLCQHDEEHNCFCKDYVPYTPETGYIRENFKEFE